MPYLLEHEFMNMHHIDFIDIEAPNLISSGNTKSNTANNTLERGSAQYVQPSNKLEDRQRIAFIKTRERIGRRM